LETLAVRDDVACAHEAWIPHSKSKSPRFAALA
jgi:hypothetical protein